MAGHTTRRECARVQRAARGAHAAGHPPDAETIPDHQAQTVEEQLLAAERHAALREAFARLPPCRRRLITLLIQDPPVPYATISARLNIPVGSIGPNRGRCLDKLHRDPAIAALISAEAEERKVNGRPAGPQSRRAVTGLIGDDHVRGDQTVRRPWCLSCCQELDPACHHVKPFDS